MIPVLVLGAAGIGLYYLVTYKPAATSSTASSSATSALSTTTSPSSAQDSAVSEAHRRRIMDSIRRAHEIEARRRMQQEIIRRGRLSRLTPPATSFDETGADIVSCSREFTDRGYGDLIRRAYAETPSHTLAEQLDEAIHVMKGPLGCEEFAQALDSAQTHVLTSMSTPAQHLTYLIREAQGRGADPRYVAQLRSQYNALHTEAHHRRVMGQVAQGREIEARRRMQQEAIRRGREQISAAAEAKHRRQREAIRRGREISHLPAMQFSESEIK